MVKSYPKYEQAQTFGVVASPTSNVVWTSDDLANNPTVRNTGAGRAYVGANEQVLCWDIKKGELLSAWRDVDCTAEVTVIAQSRADSDVFAVGYGDGSIRLWDSKIGSVLINFNGHRSAVTKLAFDDSGVRLASGAKDTDIIVWDLVGETGLFKLRGHKDQITGLSFIQTSTSYASFNGGAAGEDLGPLQTQNDGTGPSYLLSTGKDALLKLWDLSTQYCIESRVTQSNGECWALSMSPDHVGCITGGNDGELKVWSIDHESLLTQTTQQDDSEPRVLLHDRGTLRRQGTDRSTGISFHPTANYVAVYGSEKAIELLRIRTPEEIQKSLSRKRRRKREKSGLNNEEKEVDDTEMADGEEASTTSVTEVFKSVVIVRTGGKVRSVDWAGGRSSKTLQLVAATSNNQLEMYSVSAADNSKALKSNEPPEYNRTFAVELPGHRTDIRAVSISSDDRMLATASSGSLKIWNIQTKSCLRTLDCGYALCCAFLPGDKIVIVGNKNGDIEVFDIAASALIDTIKAHDGAIWTLKVHPDGLSVVTGSADKSAKFWRFEVVQEDIPGTKRTTPRLKLIHTRTLKVNDDVLSLCFSPDARLLAVATLDITVKVFFVDTLKQYLTLYGHKLPVLSMSISSDSKIIATSSADKNVRLWGLDFGDCHKAFFAHDDSIMSVAFVRHPISKDDAHLFFSASKDGLLKTWDGDKFTAVQRLSGHHGEIWAMLPSQTGDFVVTASHDRSIRVWALSDEPLFLEEERERELELLYDNNLAESLERDRANADAAAAPEDAADVVPASKQTAATLTSSEKITEALTICTADAALVAEHARTAPPDGPPAPSRHPLLVHSGRSAAQHLLHVVASVPAAALQDALLLLQFGQLPPLLEFVGVWLARRMQVPLACRVLFFLLRTHQRQIVASRELRALLGGLRETVEKCLEEWRGVVGFNLAAVKVLGLRVAEEGVGRIEEAEESDVLQKGRKRGFVSVA